MNNRDQAISLARQGFKVFPITPGAKAPPLILGWQIAATADEAQVRAWWTDWPSANIGIHCDGLIVIDVDERKGGDESLVALEAAYDLPPTLDVATPSGGHHLYYRSVAAVANGVNVYGRGIDIRSSGGYVLAPGSEVDGKPYKIVKHLPIAEAPAFLAERTAPPKPDRERQPTPQASSPTARDRAIEWLIAQESVVEGERNHTGYVVACKLRDFGLNEADTAAVMREHWKCQPPLDDAEINHLAHSASNYAQNDPGVLSAEAMFDVIKDAPETPVPRAKYPRRKKLSEIKTTGGNGNFVDGLCNLGEMFQVIGAPGERKSQAAGWLAYCVATGQPWLGRKTTRGCVLYVAAEREREQARRFQVWALSEDRELDKLPIAIMGPGGHLTDKDFAHYLVGEIKALEKETGLPCVLTVLDTLFVLTAGANLNDMAVGSNALENVAIVAAQAGPAVGVVHHTPKSGKETGQGTSALDARYEATIMVEKTPDGGVIRLVKANSVTDWMPETTWTGERREVQRDGETLTAWRPLLGGSSYKSGSAEDQIVTALAGLLVGVEKPTRTVTKDMLRDATPGISKSAFYRGLRRLAKREIGTAGDYVWLQSNAAPAAAMFD